MAQVTSYAITHYGTDDGWGGTRSIVYLFNGNNRIGYIRFREQGTLPADDDNGNRILMYLPLSLLESVIDMLRNEGPVYLNFIQGHALLSTGKEPAGVGDIDVP